ncbi:MAG: ATP synthase F0 subunit B [Deferribacteraceae bacterium]|jgi:F-type H+-transporting ATPase subunit b|nr:ATP synthase F0 subunit B [Deferribacteraceae bacterium]
MVQVGLDFTLIMQVVQFLLIVLIVKFFIVAPIHRTYTNRDNKILKLQEDAKASAKAMEAKRLEYEASLQAAKAEITEYNNALAKESAARANGIIDKVKSEIAAAKDEARKTIAAETAIAKESLGKESLKLTEDIIHLVTK